MSSSDDFTDEISPHESSLSDWAERLGLGLARSRTLGTWFVINSAWKASLAGGESGLDLNEVEKFLARWEATPPSEIEERARQLGLTP
jgi:hypothetical protein